MSVKGKKVSVRRSELHTQELILPLWEIPILQAIHDQVDDLGDEIISGRDLPDAKEEYERLEARYKRARHDDGSLGEAVVVEVFGKHGAGVQMLKRAIEEARVAEDSLV